ncbi:MAG: hypothetical protein Q9181_008081 [Wetmoreana brouardii]
MAQSQLVVRSRQKPMGLEDLPQEVHDLIFLNVPSKSSLWPILFLSKKMYRAVLPSLYQKISFEIDSSVGTYHANYDLLRMADKENQGLLHIQVVELSVQDELSRHKEEEADYPDAAQLLSAIPRDSLMKFRYG